MEQKPIDIAEKFSRLPGHWSPGIIAQMNEYHFKLVKLQGDFVWHSHPDTDEVFIVFYGAMTIHFRDVDVPVAAGEMFVVPMFEFRPFLTSLGTSGSSRSRRDDDCDPRSRSWRRSNEELDDPDVPPKGPALFRRGKPTQGYFTIRSHAPLRGIGLARPAEKGETRT